MRDALNTVTYAVGEIVRRIDAPVTSCPVVRLLFLGNSVGSDVPHLRITARDVLLHPQKRCLRLVLSVSHISKFLGYCQYL